MSNNDTFETPGSTEPQRRATVKTPSLVRPDFFNIISETDLVVFWFLGFVFLILLYLYMMPKLELSGLGGAYQLTQTLLAIPFILIMCAYYWINGIEVFLTAKNTDVVALSVIVSFLLYALILVPLVYILGRRASYWSRKTD
jgi:hypothetical protein